MNIRGEYSIEDALSDFTIDEITEGIEDALSSPDEIEVEVTAKDETNDSLTCITCEESNVYTQIHIDNKMNELVATSCGCSQFRNDFFNCKHVQKLLCQYLIERSGVHSVEGTEIEKKLIERTGIDTPLVPGILRKTDSVLSNFLKLPGKVSAIADPVWKQTKNDTKVSKSTKGYDRMKLECGIATYGSSDRVSIWLKAGPKNGYIIRKMDHFLEAYKTSSAYQFSSSVASNVTRDKFDEKGRAVLDFLLKIYEDYKRRKQVSMLFVAVGGGDHKEMWIDGSDLDVLMDILDGSDVTYTYNNEDKRQAKIVLDEPLVDIILTKEEFGVTLHVESIRALGHGLDHMYLFENGIIKRQIIDRWSKYKELSDTFLNANDVYVQNHDVPALCKALISVTDEADRLVSKGFELTEYIPESPENRIYLDYSQDNFISCQIKSYYRSLDKEYIVFDQKKDAKKRNLLGEQTFVEKVWPYFDAYDDTNKELVLECTDDILFAFLVDTVPILSAFGEIFISDKLKKLRVRPAGDFSVGVQVDAGKLTMSLKSNILSKSEMIEILSSYNRKKKYTRLKNGEFITFDQDKVDFYEMIVEQYRNYGKKDPEAFKVPLFRAIYLNEVFKKHEDLSLNANGKYKKLIKKIYDEKEREYEPPKSLREVLREYQTEGFRWMKMLKESGFGGILADDMGLGKTLQILAFLLSEFEEGKPVKELVTLIVAPASLIYNWQHEVERFTPKLKCKVIAGTVTERRKMIAEIGREEDDTVIYVTSYDLLKRDLDLYESISFANQVIDEAQFIKNQNTNVSKGVRTINSDFRIALTGTPIENRLSDMWSIFDYLMPGFLYSYARFRQEYETQIVNDKDEYVIERLRNMVHPFILRRLKKDVLKDLPDKIEETVSVRLEGEQRKLYDAYAERLRQYLENKSDADFNESKIEILAELTKLRQICCGPELILDKYKGGNAKMDACLELVKQAIDGNHKVLIFSQFTSVLDEIGKNLKKEQIEYHRIDGSVKKETRMELVDFFQNDNVPVFIISLKAGGTGLNLTAADIVIHYDPWWNVAAQNQATDRAHRIGQENHVTVYQLVSEKTIEEQIVNLQSAKAKLADDVLSGEGISSILINKEDLLAVL